jgi:hypothetical protein
MIRQLAEVVGQQITLEIHAQTFPTLDDLRSLYNTWSIFTINAKVEYNKDRQANGLALSNL